MPSRPARRPRLLGPAVLLGLGACASSGPPAPTALDKLREPLLGEVVIPSLERTLGKIDAMASKGMSPFKGEDLRGLIFARAGLPPEVFSAVDLNQPVSFVVVRGAVKADPLPVVAFAARPGQAERILTLLGARKQGAQSGAAPSGDEGTPSARINGAVVVVAPSGPALAAGADIAEASRRAVAEDVFVAAYPAASARWQGLEPAKAGELLRAQALRAYDGDKQGPATPARVAERASLTATLDQLVGPLGEIRAVELGLSIDDRGLGLALRALPVQGSAFAKRVGARPPYRLDERALGAAPAVVTSSGGASFLLDLFAAVLREQAKAGVKGAAEVSRRFAAATGYLTRGQTVVLRSPSGRPVYEAILAAGSAAAARAALDELSKLVASPVLGELLAEVYGARAPRVTARRTGDRLDVRIAVPPGRSDLRHLLGDHLDVVVVTSGERLVLTSEPDPTALARLLAEKATTPPPRELADALANTAGADGFGYVDLWALVTPIISASGIGGTERAFVLGILPALGSLKLPIVFSTRGGESLVGELRLPAVTLSSVTGALRIFGGGNLGGALTPGP